MLEQLPEDIRKGLEDARRKAARKGSRLCVHVGEDVFPIHSLSDTGFVVDPRTVPRLRGLVDIYDGPRHLSQALIIAVGNEGDLMAYEFKRETPVTQTPIRDYAEDRALPAGYLTRPT